jgi:hypothetical protein
MAVKARTWSDPLDLPGTTDLRQESGERVFSAHGRVLGCTPVEESLDDVLTALVRLENVLLLAVVPVLLYAGVMAFFALGPDRTMATTFFRPNFTGGIWALGEPLENLFYYALIGNGFNLMGVEPVYQRVFLGMIMLTAVAIDAWTRKTRAS